MGNASPIRARGRHAPGHSPPTIDPVEWKYRRRDDEATDRPDASAPGRSTLDAVQLSVSALDALQVGVLVLDADDRPVVVNSAAREMGLVRTKIVDEAHTIIRTLAGQVRRSGAIRVVELDLPRAV